MIGFVLLISMLALIGGTVIWCAGRRRKAVRAPSPLPGPVMDAQDRLPESGNGGAERALAAFYAYQMAAEKIHRWK